MTDADQCRLRMFSQFSRQISTSTKERVNIRFRYVQCWLENIYTALKRIRDTTKFEPLEHQITELEHWTTFHEPESKMVRDLINSLMNNSNYLE